MHSMNVTMASVTAMALTAELGNIECIDRLASVAEIRRNAILREIDLHRAPLARALRDKLRDIEDTKFETIEPKRVTAKIKNNKDAASSSAGKIKARPTSEQATSHSSHDASVQSIMSLAQRQPVQRRDADDEPEPGKNERRRSRHSKKLRLSPPINLQYASAASVRTSLAPATSSSINPHAARRQLPHATPSTRAARARRGSR